MRYDSLATTLSLATLSTGVGREHAMIKAAAEFGSKRSEPLGVVDTIENTFVVQFILFAVECLSGVR